jgi:hypothetical protein
VVTEHAARAFLIGVLRLLVGERPRRRMAGAGSAG